MRAFGWKGILALSPIWIAACAWRTPSAPTAQHFIAVGPLDSELLILEADGSFRFFRRTHLTVEETARGAWSRAQEGIYALRGPWRRQVIQGPLAVGGFDGPEGPSLDEIRDELVRFLEAAPDEPTRSAAEVRQIGLRSRTDYVLVPVTVRADPVPRKELMNLLAAIDAYRSSGPPDVIHVRPLQADGRAFLHWIDGGPGWVEDSLDDIRRAVATGRSLPSFDAVFLEVSEQDFHEALGTGHPFRFQRPP